MGVYAYCVVPHGHRPADTLRGLGGEKVEFLATQGIGLWISRMARPAGSVALVKAHNAVVEAAVTDQITPVPLRFGQWVDSEAGFLAAMAEKASSYEDQLRKFAGCLEFGLRMIDPAGPGEARDVHPSTPTSGFEYMQALRESTRLAEQKRVHAERVQTRIHDMFQDIVRAEQADDARTPHAVVTLSHLVARANFDEYRERARLLRETFPLLRLLLSGPWPPYSFAT